jgi:hypothetical protein
LSWEVAKDNEVCSEARARLSECVTMLPTKVGRMPDISILDSIHSQTWLRPCLDTSISQSQHAISL